MENKLHDLPIRIFLGRLSNITKSDARNYCKGLINKYFDDKENTYYSIKKSNNHIYYEIQEGGNKKSFLPTIVKFIEDPEKTELIIPSGTNNTKIKKIEDSVIFEILTEEDPKNIEKEEYLKVAKRSGGLTPFESDKKNLLAFSFSYLLLGFVFLITSYYLYFTKPTIKVDNQIDFNFQSFKSTLNRMERIGDNVFVGKLFFEKNQWNIDILPKKSQNEVDNNEVDNNDMKKPQNRLELQELPLYNPEEMEIPQPIEDRG